MGPRRRRVVWTQGAVRELDEATEFIAADSPQAAIAVLERLLAAAESLAELPDRGRVVPERGDATIREVLVDSYRLIYSVSEAGAAILGVLHQRRDFEGWDRANL